MSEGLKKTLDMVADKQEGFQLAAAKYWASNNKARTVYVQPSQMALFEAGLVSTVTVSATKGFPFVEAWELIP